MLVHYAFDDDLEDGYDDDLLLPLIEKLREGKSAYENKSIILNFVNKLKAKKGLEIEVSGEYDEDSMYGKLPLKEWVLPLGNSLNIDVENNDYLENLNLFGLSSKGIENGIDKFSDPENIVHQG